MDVCLRKCGIFCSILLFILTLGACSNHYDTSTAAGENALIYDANTYLSHGQCQLAYNAIIQLYGTPKQTEEIQLIMASTYACFAGFNMLNLAANLVGATNYFNVLAESLPGKGHSAYMYQAVDVLTGHNAASTAASRTPSVNNYMVFIQAGLIGTILSNYGNPSTAGVKGTDLLYHLPTVAGDMATIDACALEAAFAIVEDSLTNCTLSDSTTTSFAAYLNHACSLAGYPLCSILNKDRTACTGTAGDVPSTEALGVVTAVNSAW